MAAIADIPPALQFPAAEARFAAPQRVIPWGGARRAFGESGAKVAMEALEALRRIRSRFWMEATLVANPLNCRIDPIHAAAELRAYAAAQGIEFDALVQGAAAHFQSAEINRRETPLTPEELEFLVDDDARAIDR